MKNEVYTEFFGDGKDFTDFYKGKTITKNQLGMSFRYLDTTIQITNIEYDKQAKKNKVTFIVTDSSSLPKNSTYNVWMKGQPISMNSANIQKLDFIQIFQDEFEGTHYTYILDTRNNETVLIKEDDNENDAMITFQRLEKNLDRFYKQLKNRQISLSDVIAFLNKEMKSE